MPISRKVVGWNWTGTLAARLPIAGVGESDCRAPATSGPGASLPTAELQYGSGDYVRILSKHQMIPEHESAVRTPMTTPVAESFMKTLKREEIYANDYPRL